MKWDSLNSRWDLFKDGPALTRKETIQRLFNCCDEDLGKDISGFTKECLWEWKTVSQGNKENCSHSNGYNCKQKD